MFLPLMLVAAAAAAPAESAAPAEGDVTAKTEILSIDAPDQFDVGYRGNNQSLTMMELVEPPETVETWSRLITLQLFFDRAKTGSLDSFYAGWRDSLKGACAAAMTASQVKGTVDGRPAIRSSMACPLNPATAKPENLTAVMVQGEVNMMLVQVAFRRAPTADDKALIARIADSLKLCDARKLEACSARKPGGFIADPK